MNSKNTKEATPLPRWLGPVAVSVSIMLIAAVVNAVADYPVPVPVMLIGAVCIGIAASLGNAIGAERAREDCDSDTAKSK